MSLRSLKRKQQQKTFKVKVITMESELELSCEMDWKGKDLFELVCKHLVLKETWFFGLQYVANGMDTWLKLDKKVLQQDVPKEDPLKFRFLAKFYPENVSEELFQDITQHLFFLQHRSNETAELLAEKVQIAEDEAKLLAQDAVEARHELQRLELAVLKSKDEMRMMEKKMRESDMITMKLLQESDRRAKEVEMLEQDLQKAREAERITKQRLLELGNICQPSPTKGLTQDTSENDNKIPRQDVDTEYKRLSLEIEKERMDYLEKSKRLENQLNELKLEIQALKQEDRHMTTPRLWNSSQRSKYNLHGSDTYLMQTYKKEQASPYCISPLGTIRSCVDPDLVTYTSPIRMVHTLPSNINGRENQQNTRKVEKCDLDVIYI
ncbi:hypothetical protein GDO81_005685 [Engystomops pustulosus]|uniref:FERM domain-containing protein n=2 Tax=Engystomops pustulosus TaxID=76066 RepID=A0AAV7CRU9_ENGPU|nr:hypothetical protein GDO81_005685 [Engystomops pustulosus]KAG8587490.1 hypothetical protein GDO81_005685 [Engystomops pustulosus]KAG8587491.1 hypothetical protein GDO81_005685 [Engystomops pustulosus]KAG8587492.1 hypothetical protein GDO81_005685 [Engystomops pustulosus]KAG8587493.1 hypothetical protein GDO81_005685 [Engystomops pustulosus]